MKDKLQKLRAKLLNSYYGNPIKDLKLIIIAGANGKSTVTNFTHDILKAAGKKVSIYSSDKPFKTAVLHKFLSDAWKVESEFVIVTAPLDSIKNNVFYGLPINILAITDFAHLPEDASLSDYINTTSLLFENKPNSVILNRNDSNFDHFNRLVPSTAVLTYGNDMNSNFKILNAKLYPKGSEATFAFSGHVFSAASFLTNDNAPFYMACAATITTTFDTTPDQIVDGLSNYIPKDFTPNA